MRKHSASTNRLAVVLSVYLVLCVPDYRSLFAVEPSPIGNRERVSEPVESITAILGAMAIEIKRLEEQLSDKTERKIQEMTFIEGRLGGKRVVLAQCGVGKVNAAIATTLLLEHYRPARVLMTGVAGGINPELRTGDIVIGAKTAHHDFGDSTPNGLRVRPTRSPLSKVRNPLYFPAEESLVAVAEQAAAGVTRELERKGTPFTIKTGVIVTGDTFITSTAAKLRLRQDHQADATEMEGAAVAQVCWQSKVPCLVIRSLSDTADEKANADVEMHARTSAERCTCLITAIVEKLN